MQIYIGDTTGVQKSMKEREREDFPSSILRIKVFAAQVKFIHMHISDQSHILKNSPTVVI